MRLGIRLALPVVMNGKSTMCPRAHRVVGQPIELSWQRLGGNREENF